MREGTYHAMGDIDDFWAGEIGGFDFAGFVFRRLGIAQREFSQLIGHESAHAFKEMRELGGVAVTERMAMGADDHFGRENGRLRSAMRRRLTVAADFTIDHRCGFGESHQRTVHRRTLDERTVHCHAFLLEYFQRGIHPVFHIIRLGRAFARVVLVAMRKRIGMMELQLLLYQDFGGLFDNRFHEGNVACKGYGMVIVLNSEVVGCKSRGYP